MRALGLTLLSVLVGILSSVLIGVGDAYCGYRSRLARAYGLSALAVSIRLLMT